MARLIGNLVITLKLFITLRDFILYIFNSNLFCANVPFYFIFTKKHCQKMGQIS